MMTKKKTRKEKENGGKIGTPKETVKGDKDTQLHLQIDTKTEIDRDGREYRQTHRQR